MLNKFARTLLNSLAFALCCSQALALPELNQVIQGEIELSSAAATLLINQSSEKAIVNWNSFNIAAQESVQFQQATNAICLNRVDAANGMSQIAGNLTATGRIYLINQAGILFADSAQVNVGGLVASAADIADELFINNYAIFDRIGTTPAAIINRGNIKAVDGGFVALLGAGVSNEGVIQANLSQVFLKNGNKFSFDLYGNGLINFALEEAASGAGVDENGVPLPHGLNVSGEIIADSGAVYVSSKAVSGVFDNLINLDGEVRAQSSANRAGGIYLVAHEGNVKITGTLDVHGAEENSAGGAIVVFGNTVAVKDEATLAADGGRAGGYIQIGNIINVKIEDNPIPTTKKIVIGPDAVLSTDATASGFGGRVIVSSTEQTKVLGTVSSRGTGSDGNGGFIEISSKGNVIVDEDTANIDVSSENGKVGLLLQGPPQAALRMNIS